jgi:hypothetical protein
MAVAALVVAIVAALGARAAVMYARRLDQATRDAAGAARESAVAAQRSAVAAEGIAVLDAARRHDELTPQFVVSCTSAPPQFVDTLRLTVFLAGPAQLGRLDELIVRIRDDYPYRSESEPLPGAPTREQVSAQIWGPYRFVQGKGMGSIHPLFRGPDATGRMTSTREGIPVGEEWPFFLGPTLAPTWAQQSPETWRAQVGTILRLQLECRREGLDPWSLPCELDTAHLPVTVNVPQSLDG